MSRKPASTVTPEHGNIGNYIFQRVEALVADQAMSKAAAIQVVARETDSKPSTVQANYYRVARQHGAIEARTPKETATKQLAHVSDGDVDRLATLINTAVTELVTVAKARGQRLQKLEMLEQALQSYGGA
jgi:hypothetical protein